MTTQQPSAAGDCPTRYYLLALVVMSAGAYWLWPPFGAVLIVLGASGLRTPLQRGAMFWAPAAAYVVGALWGTGFAIATTALAHFAFHALWSRIGFAAFTVVCVLYLGYGTCRSRFFIPPWEEKIVVAQVIGLFCYVPLVAIGIWVIS